MASTAIVYKFPRPGTGYTRQNGRKAETEEISLIGQQTIAAASGTTGGIIVGDIYDVGEALGARLVAKCTAKSGTSPTADITIQTSRDGMNGWRTVAAFAQIKDSANATLNGPVMGAVTATGTTPPTITLTSTSQVVPVTLRIECTTLGARGTAVIRYSIDNGITYVSNVLTAATISVVDPNGIDTGVVINYANATAATDNVWTASTVSYEEKTFSGFDKFVRAVTLLGGSSTPTMDLSVTGDLLY